jgi:hypothetical protein
MAMAQGLPIAPDQRLSQRRAKPSKPCGMKITIAMKMIPTGIR